MCVVLLLSFWGASTSASFVAGVKFSIIYVMDVQITTMIKQVNGLNGCHKKRPCLSCTYNVLGG